MTADLQLVAMELERTAYEPVRYLGRGAMGMVVEVNHRFLGTRHAAKLLRAEVGEDPYVRDRFATEAMLLTRIHHPNMLRVTDLGETRTKRLFLISELLEGEDLRQRIKRAGPLPPDLVVDCLAQALDGLAAAHARGVIHRDIKPGNVFLCNPREGAASGVTKLLDFGIAKVLTPPGGKAPTFAPKGGTTKPGRLVGTPAFVAPEQVLAKPVGARTDIYGMGATVYYALTGGRLFQASDLADMLRAIVLDAPEAPSKRAAHPIPAALDAVVLRALAKDPADRFASAEEMAEALRAALPAPAPVMSARDGGGEIEGDQAAPEVGSGLLAAPAQAALDVVAEMSATAELPSSIEPAPPTAPLPSGYRSRNVTATAPPAASPTRAHAGDASAGKAPPHGDPLAGTAPMTELPPGLSRALRAGNTARAPGASQERGIGRAQRARRAIPSPFLYVGTGLVAFIVAWLILWFSNLLP